MRPAVYLPSPLNAPARPAPQLADAHLRCGPVRLRRISPAPGARSAVDGRLPTKQHMEGTGMDPDLDPNLQHWQDRFDSLQWVEGSLVALLDSMPT